jgi:hypothetical protein
MRDEIDTERCRELADKKPTTYDHETFTELENLILDIETTVRALQDARTALHEASHTGEQLLSGREHNTVVSAERDVQEVVQPYNDLLMNMRETYRDADKYLYG